MKRKIHILIGLPGSGKTYFARIFKESFHNTILINEDEVMQNTYSGNVFYEIKLELKRNIKYSTKGDIVVDALILTNQNIIDILKELNDVSKQFDVVLHVWNEDRETCIKNDAGRRTLSNKQTIKTIPYETIDLDLLKRYLTFNIKIENHKVVLKPSWKLFLDKKTNFKIKNDYLISSKWCLGGVSGNYHGDTYTVSADPQPDFEEFDELLEIVCPNITYLQYKKISRNCVTIEESEEYEYYGSHYNYANYKLDLNKFIECIGDMDIPHNLVDMKGALENE